MEFRVEELCFLVHILEFEVIVFVPAQNLFMPPPPQSRYPGARPDGTFHVEPQAVNKDLCDRTAILGCKHRWAS